MRDFLVASVLPIPDSLLVSMEKQEEFESDPELEIEPREMNPTESRLLTLLFNFFQFPEGLTLSGLKDIMGEFYDNENKDSDRRKLSRDIQELESLGFRIRYYPQKHDKDFVYVLETDPWAKSLRFDPNELREISAVLLEAYSQSPRYELYTAAQKIFAGELGFFPELKEEPREISDESGRIAFFVLEALKNRSPLRLKYFKSFPEDSYFIEVDPVRLLRRGGEDYYLLAYDRSEKIKKRLILAKILEAEILEGDFIYQKRGTKAETWEDQIVHAALFPVHEPRAVALGCKTESLVKAKQFLSGIPLTQEGNTIRFECTNLEGLLPFLWKEGNSLEKIEPEELKKKLKDSLLFLAESYGSDFS